MKDILWMSGEIQADVDSAFTSAAKEVKRVINLSLLATTYGAGFSRLCLIPILLQDNSDYPEVRRYHKKDKDFEFRFKIPHAEFKAADALGQRRLIVENILRAVDEMKKMGIKDVEVGKLERAIRNVAAAHDWLPATRSN